MNCRQCWERIPPNVAHCPFCGTKIDSSEYRVTGGRVLGAMVLTAAFLTVGLLGGAAASCLLSPYNITGGSAGAGQQGMGVFFVVVLVGIFVLWVTTMRKLFRK